MTDYFEEELKVSGIFELPTGEKAPGMLNFAGPESYLYLWGESLTRLPRHLVNSFSIKGVLGSGSKVSLINCRNKGVYNPLSNHLTKLSFFFDYAVSGDIHISHEEEKVEKITFTMNDAESLFYEHEVFGAIIGGYISPEKKKSLAFPPWESAWPEVDARPFVESILRSEGSGSDIEVGENPVIFYHTGKTRILDVETGIGRVSVSRNDPVETYAEFLGNYEREGNSGVNIETVISITLEFDRTLVLENAISRALRVSRFLELLIGRSQNFASFLINKSGTPRPLRVYGCRFPAHERFSRQSYFPLFSAVRNTDEFSRIMARWLKTDNGRWREARDRFFSCFDRGWNYDTDRLIAAANMFDLLPPEAFPERPKISEDLEAARDKCRGIFNELPDSPDRQSVLSELGRVGKNISLKKKIRHRAQLVIDQVGESKMPKLLESVGKAVDCRNRYVHGPKDDDGPDYGAEKIRFLTETLEFVFAASDLIEAGWDMKTWSSEGGYPDHPLRSYFQRHSTDSRLFGKHCLLSG